MRYAATLAAGLRENSRTVRAVTASPPVSQQSLLLAILCDRVGHLIWMQTEDGRNGVNHPKSILDAMTGTSQTKEETHLSFSSKEEFEKARKEMIERVIDGGN